MAYSYQDFVNAATKSGLIGQFDDNDLQLAQQHPEYGLSMLSLKRDYGNAQTDEQKLLISEAANQLRGSYAPKYNGSGNTYAASGSGSTYAADGTTQQQTTPAVAGVANTSGAFSYSLKDDPVWSDYRKEYLREGDRATANALGQASAASAGRASSYAVNAATQAGDYYATQLTDKIPELYQDAWNREMQLREQENNQMSNAYTNLSSQIVSTGYIPTEEEMAAAGMNQALVDQMLNAWIVSNPDAAWQQQRISAEDYYRLTGKSPTGSTGGGGNNQNSFLNDYIALLNDKTISSGTINSWIVRQQQAGNITAEQAKALSLTGLNREADKNIPWDSDLMK